MSENSLTPNRSDEPGLDLGQVRLGQALELGQAEVDPGAGSRPFVRLLAIMTMARPDV
jgi:hypothetical protein